MVRETQNKTNNSASTKEFLNVLKGILDLGLTPRELRFNNVSASFVKNEAPDTIPSGHPDFFNPDQTLNQKENKKKADEEELFYSSG